MHTKWITHNGKRVLLADYSGFDFDTAGAREEMDYAVQLARLEPYDSVLTLTDINGTKASPEMYTLIKDTAASISPYAHKRAVVGLMAVQRKLLDLINKMSGNKTFVTFADRGSALDWLTED